MMENENPTSMVVLPSGGMLLMSLVPYEEKGVEVTEKSFKKTTAAAEPEGNTPEYIWTERGAMEDSSTNVQNATEHNPSTSEHTGAESKFSILKSKFTDHKTDSFVYPELWKGGKIPKFPNIPANNLEKVQEGSINLKRKDNDEYNPWEEGEMPTFPNKNKNKKKPPASLEASSVQPATEFTNGDDDQGLRLDNRVEAQLGDDSAKWTMTEPQDNKDEESNIVDGPEALKENAKLEEGPPHKSSLLHALLNSRPREDGMSDRLSGGLEDVRSRYRTDPDPFAPHENINVVIPGEYRPSSRPNGVEHCKLDSSTGGKRVCTSTIANNCQNGFKIGGNCNGQERLDNTNLPQSDYQMGAQFKGMAGSNIVPFSLQQTSMNMLQIPRPSHNDQSQYMFRPKETTRSTTATTTSTSTTTTETTTLSHRDAMIQRVMSMDPPALVDAFMDPMMMAMGTMLAMAGAYMAIAIDELNSANALAFAVGKRKRRSIHFHKNTSGDE